MAARSAFDQTRRSLLAAAGAGAALAVHPGRTRAQGLSDRTIRFLLAQTPGTSPDFLARTIAPRLQARWNQTAVVENRPGAAGAIGLEALAKSPPDGHTVTINPSSTLTLPLFFPLNFDVLESFSPITIVGGNIFALTVHSGVPAKDVREFIAWVKTQGGGRVNYGSPGNGTHHHLFMEQFKLAAGTDMTHIPYKGSAGSFADLLGGQISAMFLPMGAAMNMARDGKVRILGGSSRERSPLSPDIPSIAEQGVKGFDLSAWFDAFAPAHTPADIIARWNTVLREILHEPPIRDALAKQSISVIANTAEEADLMRRMEYKKFENLVKTAHIKGD